MKYTPIYELTIYAPRTVDPTETTVLTPVPGAAHSDPFVVTTAAGIAGAQPYLAEAPTGWHGKLDTRSGRTTTGQLSARLIDMRTTPGGSNAARWVTAFLGDVDGKTRFKGCKIRVRESLDGGATWSSTYTGRVTDVGLDGRIPFLFTIKDFADDQNREIFVGSPSSALTAYAFRATMAPLGLSQAYGPFKPFAKWVPGQINGVQWTRTLFGYTSTVSPLDVAAGADQWLTVITRATRDHGFGATELRVRIRVLSGPTTGQVGALRFNGPDPFALVPLKKNFKESTNKKRWQRLGPLDTLPPSDPDYIAMPAPGTSVEFYVVPTDPPSKDFPIFIDNVHPVQLWADIIDGKLSRLNADGTPRPIAGRDTAPGGPWAQLLADPSIGSFRGTIDKTWKANDFIEKAICQPYQLGYRLDGTGNVVPIDLRRSSGVASAVTITSADLAEGAAPTWGDTVQGAAPLVGINYYVDAQRASEDVKNSADEFPDVPSTLIVATQDTILPVGDPTAFADLGDVKPLIVDAIGIRIATIAPALSALEANANRERLTALAREIGGPYANGPTTFGLTCRRTANTTGLFPGTWCSVTVDELPDPATNARGGTRLALCTSREEQGLSLRFEFLDAGAGGVALPPTLGALAAVAGSLNELTVLVTRNAAGAPVQLAIAITDTATAVRPAPADAAWRTLATVDANGTVTLGPLPSGARIWVRGRSLPTGGGELPSSWVFPTAPGYLDLGARAAPTGLAVSSITGGTARASWTPGDATLRTEVYLHAGGIPGAWDATMRVATLDPGYARYSLAGLTPSTTYGVGVRHVDGSGGVSAMATTTFVTSGALTILTPPGDEEGFSGASPGDDVGTLNGTIGIAVVATEIPGWVEVAIATETGVGTGLYGAYVTQDSLAESKAGTWTVWETLAPDDGRRRMLKARHVADGYSPSPYTSPVVVTPWTLDALPAYPTDDFHVEIDLLDADNPAEAASLVKLEVTGIDPQGQPVQVRLVGLTANSSIYSGPGIGVLSPNGQVWKLRRPDYEQGIGEATFEAVTDDGRIDSDTYPYPEVGRDTVGLRMRIRQTYKDATTVKVRVAVIDPYPQGAGSITLDWTEHGTGGVAPAGPVTTGIPTPIFDTTGSVEFTVTRPPFGSGQGTVTFVASAANRVSDPDHVQIDPQEQDTTPLAVQALATGTETSTTIDYAVKVVAYTGTPSCVVRWNSSGASGAGTAVPAFDTVSAAADFGSATAVTFTVNKPAAGASARTTFYAAAPGYALGMTAVDVPAQAASGGGSITPVFITNIRITSFNDSTEEINVAWNATTGADHFDVYRRVDGGSWTYADTTSGFSISDTGHGYNLTSGLSPSHSFEYQARAYDASSNLVGVSEASASVTIGTTT